MTQIIDLDKNKSESSIVAEVTKNWIVLREKNYEQR